jgi:acyl-CoA reductase-like NAD-dependent aldehyde dehydrogenase
MASSLSPQKIFVAGEWVESSKPLPVVNPFTGQIFFQTFLADPAQVKRALTQLTASFKKSPHPPASHRVEICEVVARKINEQAQDFAKLIVQEAGKPLTDALREVKRAANVFELAAAEARKPEEEGFPSDFVPGAEGRQVTLRRFPVGPLFAVTPFNFPLNLVAHKVAPAIACGCPFILKPSPKTPLTALLLAQVLLDSGLDPLRFAVFPAENADTEKMAADPRVKILSFTGSAPAGWKLKALAPKKKVVLELGGNAAVVVEPDADLELAASRVTAGGFGYAGQTCISVQRVYLHESIHEKFMIECP